MITVQDSWWIILIAIVILLIIIKLIRGSLRIKDLEKKAVVITGCDSGFGHDAAIRLHELGFLVFAGCMFPDGPGANKLKSLSKGHLHILHLDVTNDEHVASAVKTVNNLLGDRKLWAVVNNAGIVSIGFMEWVPMEMNRKIFDVNSLGILRVTNAFLPLLRISQGRVVILSSMAGHLMQLGGGVYTASKQAAIGLANMYRLELKQFGISVHSVKPMMYKTGMFDNLVESTDTNWKSTSDEVRNAYGEKCLENAKKLIKLYSDFLANPKKNIYQVVDAIAHALTAKYPDNNYHPSAMGKLFYFLHMLDFWRLSDCILYFFIPKIEKQRPQASEDPETLSNK